jgi:hypothetical protein
MLIFYADEFGDSSLELERGVELPQLKSGTSELFVLSGVGVRDTSRKNLAEAIFKVKEKHFGARTVDAKWSATEIKGRYLVRASRSVANGKVLAHPIGYRSLNSVSKVEALVADLGLLFATFRPLVFATVVDKREMVAKQRDLHPIGIAYAYMHQRIALAMEDLYSGDAAMIAADQQTQHETFFRSGKMNDTRKQLQQNPATYGSRSGPHSPCIGVPGRLSARVSPSIRNLLRRRKCKTGANAGPTGFRKTVARAGSSILTRTNEDFKLSRATPRTPPPHPGAPQAS